MSDRFSEFADAMARPVKPAAVTTKALDRVAILGGGTDARLLAALALAEGAETRLFTAYGDELSAMQNGIVLRGAGPVGSYQVNADGAPSVLASAELDATVKAADVIFLTGPVHKQRTYAMVLADHLVDGQMLVLAPGRTFGALETRWLLGIGGCTADISIAEAGTLPYWATAWGATLNLSPAAGCCMGTLSGGNATGLATLLPHAESATSTMASSFADGSGLAEVPTLLLGGPAVSDGGPSIPMGGSSLAENETFRNLIGAEHQTVIEALAEERKETARRFGVRGLPETDAWLDVFAGAHSGDGSRPIPNQEEAHRILRDAVIGSLVPLTSAAALAGVPTPNTNAMITLASSVLKADLATAGRKLPAMGVDGDNPDAARRILEEATR
ncbi:MAG: NAD/NADP octopine/nopaline dehydrogenase family protein [Pseudomonadota bacterium]